MTLVGKVFTGLVLLTSCCFLALALMVIHTKNTWKQLVLGEQLPDNQVSLNTQIAQLEAMRQQLRSEQHTLENQLAEERAASQRAQAVLHNEVAQLETQIQSAEAGLATAKLDLETLNVVQAGSTITAEEYQQQNKQFRADFGEIQFARDQLQHETNTLNQGIHEKGIEIAKLEASCDALVAKLDQLNAILYAIDVNVDYPRHFQPAPGVVTHVGDRESVEISLGSDDGVLVGMKMHVYNGQDYAGKIQISTVQEHRAAGFVIPNFRNRPVRRGDKVIAESTFTRTRL